MFGIQSPGLSGFIGGMWVAMCPAVFTCVLPPQPLEAVQEFADVSANARGEAASDPPADKSLPIEQLVKAGLPAPDRNWLASDLKAAAEVLATLAQKEQLPRFRSRRSGAAFERITADASLDVYRDKTVPLSRRLPDALEHIDASKQILKIYLDAFTRRKVGDSEIIELMGAQLRSTAVMIELLDEFLPTLDRNDPTYPVRMQGLQKMKAGMAQVVQGNLITVTEAQAYRTSERRRLIGYMQSTFPKILPALTEEGRHEALQTLGKYVDDSRLSELKADLEKLYGSLQEGR